MIRVAVAGAAGRMGRMVIDALAERRTADGTAPELATAFEAPGHPDANREVAPGVRLLTDADAALAGADVLIDFTSANVSPRLAALAAARGVAAVVGTTGLDDEGRRALAAAAARVPVVWAPNFSLGVNLLLGLVERAARALGPEFDLEIVELHHRLKRDAPSGTALAIGEAAARGRGLRLADARRSGRDGDVGPRPAGEIGVLAVRGGDVIGEHTVHFLGPAERIELTHRAGSRAIFARGAVRAAAWIAGKPPALYGMVDVLGLGTQDEAAR